MNIEYYFHALHASLLIDNVNTILFKARLDPLNRVLEAFDLGWPFCRIFGQFDPPNEAM